jgi:hypothetical protein
VKTTNTLPKLIDALRPNLLHVAKWTDRAIWVARGWQQGAHRPNPKDRARLVKAVRAHAKVLLALADAVEREGHSQEA